jgi:hypothetical protein
LAYFLPIPLDRSTRLWSRWESSCRIEQKHARVALRSSRSSANCSAGGFPPLRARKRHHCRAGRWPLLPRRASARVGEDNQRARSDRRPTRRSGQRSLARFRRRRFTLAGCECYNFKRAGDRNNFNLTSCSRSLALGGAAMSISTIFSALVLGGLVAMTAPSTLSHAQSNDKGVSAPKEIGANSATRNTNTNPTKHRYWRHRGGKHPHFGSRRVHT